jgi:uroporphyrinogen III methyltransferase/synthase
VSLRSQLAWFETRPLFGKRILITRPQRQAEDLARRLEALGAVTSILPAVDIRPLHDWSAVDRALDRLQDYHWLVFTSANGVHAFLERLLERGKDLRALGTLRLAAIGPKTAATLQSYHLCPDLVPATYRSEDLAEALRPAVAGQRVLLARADRGRDVLPRELASICEVEQMAVYSQVDAVPADAPALDRLRRGEIDYVTLTSPSIARVFLASLDETCRLRIANGDVQLVAISPITGAEVRQAGLPVAAEASVFTTDGLIDAMIALSCADTA